MDPCQTISKSKAMKQQIWNMSIIYPEMPTGVSGHQKSCPVNWKKKKTVLLIPFEWLSSHKTWEKSNNRFW